jgi:hypothetical protein
MHVFGLHIRDLDVRNMGEDGHHAMRRVTDRLEDRVASRGNHHQKLGSGSYLLAEQQSRAVLPQKKPQDRPRREA